MNQTTKLPNSRLKPAFNLADIEIFPMSMKELRIFYNQGYKSMKKMLAEVEGLGAPTGRTYSILQVLKVFTKYGGPREKHMYSLQPASNQPN